MSAIAEAGADAPERPEQPEPAPLTDPPGRVPLGLWILGVVVASAFPIGLAWGSYFFADDYLFLSQARTTPFGWHYLGEDLFSHFSPLTRTANKVLLAVGPSWTTAWIGMLLLFAVTAFGLQWLARVLFGSTVRGLVVAAVLIQSLGLVRILQWWTATTNLLPGIAALAIGLAAYVRFRVSRNPWWIPVVLVAYLGGLVGYDLAMILPGYLVLAELFLLPRRIAAVRAVPTGPIWRRRWDRAFVGTWIALAVVGGLAALNYRVNYYAETPRPTVGVAVEALRRSLGETIPGAALGLYRPAQQSGVLVVVALLLWLGLFAATIGAKGAWKGWLFAVLGVLPPIAAVVISRAGLYGSAVGIELYYAAIPMVFLIVGAAEAVDLRLGATPRSPSVRRARLLVVGAAYGVFCLAFIWGGVGTRDVEGYAAGSRQFTTNFLRGVDRLSGDASVGVLNTTVSPRVVPLPFAPFNRADRILGIFRPDERLDIGGPEVRSIDDVGRVVGSDVTVHWSTSPAVDGPPPTAYGIESAAIEGDSWCFDTTAKSLVRWDLPEPVAGTGLTIAFSGRIDRTSPWSWFVTDGTAPFDRASYDDHRWSRSDRHGFETVQQAQVGAIALGGLVPGARMCIDQVQLLEVHPAA